MFSYCKQCIARKFYFFHPSKHTVDWILNPPDVFIIMQIYLIFQVYNLKALKTHRAETLNVNTVTSLYWPHKAICAGQSKKSHLQPPAPLYNRALTYICKGSLWHFNPHSHLPQTKNSSSYFSTLGLYCFDLSPGQKQSRASELHLRRCPANYSHLLQINSPLDFSNHTQGYCLIRKSRTGNQ